ARKLLNGEVDIALVPVAILPELPNYQLLGDYCIGTVGAVKTVCIYGDVPIEKMDAIYLDFHSRTSAMLTRLLLEEYWQHSPQLLPTQEGYIDNIGGTTGGLIIGDRTIGLEKQFQYIYDLGDIWEKYTGLPFVFAAWVSRRPLPTSFVAAFNAALQVGLAHIPQLQLLLPSPHPDFDLVEYFTHYISYDFDVAKRKGLERFLRFRGEQARVPIH
ncbi:MAG: MqnA/MqnD/SBP family protein, partial [Bacteroidota bacterium]